MTSASGLLNRECTFQIGARPGILASFRQYDIPECSALVPWRCHDCHVLAQSRPLDCSAASASSCRPSCSRAMARCSRAAAARASSATDAPVADRTGLSSSTRRGDSRPPGTKRYQDDPTRSPGPSRSAAKPTVAARNVSCARSWVSCSAPRPFSMSASSNRSASSQSRPADFRRHSANDVRKRHAPRFRHRQSVLRRWRRRMSRRACSNVFRRCRPMRCSPTLANVTTSPARIARAVLI